MKTVFYRTFKSLEFYAKNSMGEVQRVEVNDGYIDNDSSDKLYVVIEITEENFAVLSEYSDFVIQDGGYSFSICVEQVLSIYGYCDKYKCVVDKYVHYAQGYDAVNENGEWIKLIHLKNNLCW